MDWKKTTAKQDKKHFKEFKGIGAAFIRRLAVCFASKLHVYVGADRNPRVHTILSGGVACIITDVLL